MIGRKFIVVIAAMVALAGGAVVGLYLYRQGPFTPPAAEQGGPVADAGRASPPAEPGAAIPAQEPAKPQADATGALKPPAEPTSVPTFDVVLVEPNGEGVIAGRAEPGWQVSVQSGGTKVAEAVADEQGEWSVVLEKPLPTGDHALSLKITSPDGTRALSSQESVRVAVGAAEKKGNSPAATEAAKPAESLPQATAPQAAVVVPEPAPQTDASTAPAPAPPEAARAERPQGETQALARAEQGASSVPSTGTEESKPAPPKPTLVFKTVDYADTGSGSGTVTITGTSDPGAKISIYYGAEALAEVRADRDGKWRVAVAKKLGMGQHSFRAERAAAAGMLAGRAMVTIERVEPKPEAPAVVAREGPAQVAAVEGAGGQGQPTDNPNVYVIRRGDTLWAIAKRYLGSGLRYTSIFQDNRTTISNPNLIHPKQEVKVPAP